MKIQLIGKNPYFINAKHSPNLKEYSSDKPEPGKVMPGKVVDLPDEIAKKMLKNHPKDWAVWGSEEADVTAAKKAEVAPQAAKPAPAKAAAKAEQEPQAK